VANAALPASAAFEFGFLSARKLRSAQFATAVKYLHVTQVLAPRKISLAAAAAVRKYTSEADLHGFWSQTTQKPECKARAECVRCKCIRILHSVFRVQSRALCTRSFLVVFDA